MLRAVVDTNVLYAALYSSAGASHELLRLLRMEKWKLVVSNTLCAEYKEILKREAAALNYVPKEFLKIAREQQL